MGGGAWLTAVHGVAKSRTRLSDLTFTFHFHALEKEMATLQFSRLGNPMDRGARWATVHGVAKSRTRLSKFTFTLRTRGWSNNARKNGHESVVRPL